MAKARKQHVIPGKIEPARRLVPNPYFQTGHPEGSTNPRRVPANVNLRESAIVSMEHRGVIDEAQGKAAERFRMFYEMMGAAGARAQDYSREYVDGGGFPATVTDQHLVASRELVAIRELVGERNFELVRKVCGEGFGFPELTTTRRERDTMADNLRTCLDDMAVRWGMKQAVR